MDRLAEMVVFARVVEARGFSAAARKLGLDTSTVSRSVLRLESRLGGRLLHRSTRALNVTELGRGVYEGCARIALSAREIEAFAGHYASTPSGALKVSAPVTWGQMWVTPYLPEFLDLCPDVEVQLDLDDAVVDVIGDEVDVAIRIGDPVPLALVAKTLGRTRHVLVAGPRYLSTHAAPATPRDLSRHRIVGPMHEAALSFSRGTAIETVAVGSRLRINDDRAVLGAVADGAGIGLVPDVAARVAIERCHAVPLLKEWSLGAPYGERPVHALFSPSRHLPRKVRAFIDFIVAKSEAPPSLQQHLRRVA